MGREELDFSDNSVRKRALNGIKKSRDSSDPEPGRWLTPGFSPEGRNRNSSAYSVIWDRHFLFDHNQLVAVPILFNSVRCPSIHQVPCDCDRVENDFALPCCGEIHRLSCDGLATAKNKGDIRTVTNFCWLARSRSRFAVVVRIVVGCGTLGGGGIATCVFT